MIDNKVIRAFETNLDAVSCDNCGCTMRFGILVDLDDEYFKPVRIFCQCGYVVELSYDDD